MKFIVRLAMFAALALASSTAFAADEKASKEMIERGKMLVAFGGCHDCHTPKNMTPEGPVPDMSRPLSGRPAAQALMPIDKKALQPGSWMLMGPDLQTFVGPWGVSFAANLTPDEQTGLGLWTEEVFIKTIMNGKHAGDGRPLLPPMFTEGMRVLPQDDLKAVWAYLRSIPAVKNAVPQPIAPPDVK